MKVVSADDETRRYIFNQKPNLLNTVKVLRCAITVRCDYGTEVLADCLLEQWGLYSLRSKFSRPAIDERTSEGPTA